MIEIIGESKQNGKPSPENPVEIENEIYIIKDGKKIKLERTDMIRLFEQELKVATEKEKTADKMFEELGYEKMENTTFLNCCFYHKDVQHYGFREYFNVVFHYNTKRITIEVEYLTIPELQAINKKVEELRMELSKEEKEAIEMLDFFEPDDLVECAMYRNALSVVLNLIQKQEKVIDLLIDDVYDSDNFWKLKCAFEEIEKGKEKEYIKQRFYRKVEE